jgi:hypothetical protein
MTSSVALPRSAQRSWTGWLPILAVILIGYLALASRAPTGLQPHQNNYYSHLAYAILHGHLDLITTPVGDADLSVYNGHVYLNWGPAPTLLIMPLVLLFGVQVSDVVYTAVVGSITPLVLGASIFELSKRGILIVSDVKRLLLVLFFAFGTVQLTLASWGGIWSTAEVFAAFYLSISLYAALRYANGGAAAWLVGAALAFGLAAATRLTLVTMLPIVCYVVAMRTGNRRTRLHAVLTICAFFVVSMGLYGVYNAARFDSPFETGLRYHNYNQGRFARDLRGPNGAFIHPRYIPRNAWYMTLNPPELTNIPPFLRFDVEGNGIIYTSPLVLAIAALPFSETARKPVGRGFIAAALISILACIAALLVYFSTGWKQFGYRYLLDALPVFFLLLAASAQRIPVVVIAIGTIVSIAVCLLGTVWAINL